MGTIFFFRREGLYGPLSNFDDSSIGSYATAPPVEAPDGKLYGMTSQGGVRGGGTLFQLQSNLKRINLSVSDTLTSLGGVDGGGPWPVGSSATVTAVVKDPNALFVGWTENGQIVNTSTSYTFPVTQDRALAAIFTTAVTFSGRVEFSNITTNIGASIFTVTQDQTLTAIITTMVTLLANVDFPNITTDGNASVIDLYAEKVINPSNHPTGTMRMELWAFPTPYSGVSDLGTGMRLAVENFSNFTNLNNGEIPPNTWLNPIKGQGLYFIQPPPGRWRLAMLLTEAHGSVSINDGFIVDDVFHFEQPYANGGGFYSVFVTPRAGNADSTATILTGGGVYAAGASVQLTARPFDGSLRFNCWTENGHIISTSGTLSIVADRVRNLVAHFSTPVDMIGSVSYQIYNAQSVLDMIAGLVGGAQWPAGFDLAKYLGGVQMNVSEIYNQSGRFGSGELRLELWIFARPYSSEMDLAGGMVSGVLDLSDIKSLSSNTLGPNNNISRLNGWAFYTMPPGTWYPSLFLTEGDGDLIEGNNRHVASYINFASPIVVGHPAGGVKMTIAPVAAIGAGALWKVDGGNWKKSGATVNGLSVGTHAVHFSTVTGWTTPGSLTVSVSNGLVISGTGLYAAVAQPDLLVGLNIAKIDAGTIGNNIYNLDGKRQTKAVAVRRGGNTVACVWIQNEGRQPATFVLRGSPSKKGISVAYSQKGMNISSAMLAGSYLVQYLAPGRALPIQLSVSASGTAAAGAVQDIVVTATSAGKPVKQDVVKIHVIVH